MTDVMLSELDRADVERLCLHLQSLARAQDQLLRDLGSRSEWVKRKHEQFERERPRLTGRLEQTVLRLCLTDQVGHRAKKNDVRVWARFVES